ncbi:hypothetical protein GCM10010329_19670 [Streptomyces spiroverticillatus]|uniref:Uncharacterized protein n=1 Tax=Streptomyces finlayi TaxID=67296 RepID=A0A918WU68_9ACTN|nr:hypothetical protein GCM10010329_19670 [Streptomyces spiroverticillatus]GHC83222.1 hypothetical protein GCM10010334_12110 [Streptomyces finlayi]
MECVRLPYPHGPARSRPGCRWAGASQRSPYETKPCGDGGCGGRPGGGFTSEAAGDNVRFVTSGPDTANNRWSVHGKEVNGVADQVSVTSICRPTG